MRHQEGLGRGGASTEGQGVLGEHKGSYDINGGGGGGEREGNRCSRGHRGQGSHKASNRAFTLTSLT